MIHAILISLMFALPAFAQLQLGTGTNITVTPSAAPDTVMAWVSTNQPTDWHHWASNSTGSYIDGVAATFPVVPWTWDGTNLVVGEGDFAINDLRGYAAGIDPVWDALISYYAMDGNGTDSTGNYNSGTNTATESSDVPFPLAESSLYFDGTATSQIVLPYISEHTSYTAATWSAWAKMDVALGTVRHLLIRESSGVTIKSAQLKVLNSGAIQGIVGGGGSWESVEGGSFTTGVWHHVAMVYDSGGALDLYLDGVRVDRQTASVPLVATSEADKVYYIGNRETKNGTYWNGKIDELAILGRALSSNEVYRIATEELTYP